MLFAGPGVPTKGVEQRALEHARGAAGLGERQVAPPIVLLLREPCDRLHLGTDGGLPYGDLSARSRLIGLARRGRGLLLVRSITRARSQSAQPASWYSVRTAWMMPVAKSALTTVVSLACRKRRTPSHTAALSSAYVRARSTL
jgi:hypothetical protein